MPKNDPLLPINFALISDLATMTVSTLRWMEVCLYLMRILKVNLYRLAASSKRQTITSQLENAHGIIMSLKDLLLGFIFKVTGYYTHGSCL